MPDGAHDASTLSALLRRGIRLSVPVRARGGARGTRAARRPATGRRRRHVARSRASARAGARPRKRSRAPAPAPAPASARAPTRLGLGSATATGTGRFGSAPARGADDSVSCVDSSQALSGVSSSRGARVAATPRSRSRSKSPRIAADISSLWLCSFTRRADSPRARRLLPCGGPGRASATPPSWPARAAASARS